MITDDERRNVAANIRSAANRRKNDLQDDPDYSPFAALYAVFCGVRGWPHYEDLLHLADLIARPLRAMASSRPSTAGKPRAARSAATQSAICGGTIVLSVGRRLSMISNEDRVEAARFLRSCNCDTESYAKCYEISEALFGKKYAICDFNVPCGKIADLIDRPTCLDLVEHKQDPFIPGKRMVDGYFHCSDCGWDGQIWEHIGFGDMLAYEAVHCPKCGAIIERRA